MDLMEMLQNRRSVREYTGEAVPQEKLDQVLQAGLLAMSGRNRRPWEFIVVKDKEKLRKMSVCREHGAGMLAGADCAVVVVGDPWKTDVWVEDCSIAMAYMHLMADSLGLGSCWIQVRLREAPDHRTASEYLRSLLHFPKTYEVEAILSLGIAKSHKEPAKLEELPFDKIRQEQFEETIVGTGDRAEPLSYLENARNPQGADGRSILTRMRESHTDVTSWGIELMDPQPKDVILDIGCGGGRALKRIAKKVVTGRLYGVDYSPTAVELSKEENAEDVANGRMAILEGSVSNLPFPEKTFNKIISIESYYFWPDLENDLKEVLRVLKPGGRAFIVADIHKKDDMDIDSQQHVEALHMTNLSFEEFEDVMLQAGFRRVVIHGKEGTDWICAEGMKKDLT